jgi:hypothetical protein
MVLIPYSYGGDGSKIGTFVCSCFHSTVVGFIIYGHIPIVKVLSDDVKGRLRATTKNDAGVIALQIATEMKRDEIVKILTGYT